MATTPEDGKWMLEIAFNMFSGEWVIRRIRYGDGWSENAASSPLPVTWAVRGQIRLEWD